MSNKLSENMPSVEVSVKELDGSCNVIFNIRKDGALNVIKVREANKISANHWKYFGKGIFNGNNNYKIEFGDESYIGCKNEKIEFKVSDENGSSKLSLDREVYGEQMYAAIMNLMKNEKFINSCEEDSSSEED